MVPAAPFDFYILGILKGIRINTEKSVIYLNRLHSRPQRG
jgi:hypothetical protein